jgi:hypothetical protein
MALNKKRFEIDGLNIDMKTVAKEIILGPKSRLIKRLESLNRSYITSDYVYGNRSLLIPVAPLGVTRTYRWKSGYKDTIRKVIEDRFNQYGKSANNLNTMLHSRPDRMRWTKERFVKELISIESDMKELRKRKVTMEDTGAQATGFYTTIMEKIQEKNVEAKMFFDAYDDLDYDMYIVGYDKAIGGKEQSLISSEGIDKYNDIREIIKFETCSLVLDVHMKNPEMIVRNREDHLQTEVGRIPLPPVSLSFNIPFRQLVNAMFTSEFGNLKICNLRDDNTSNRYYMNLVNLDYPDQMDNCAYFHDNKIRHPFISDHDDRYNDGYRMEKWTEEIQELSHVCFGNLKDDIEEAFINLDFMGLMMLLKKWQTYVCGDTSPLNNINFTFLTIPEDKYSEDFTTAISMQPKAIQHRLLYKLGASKILSTGAGLNNAESAYLFDYNTSWGQSSYDNHGCSWYVNMMKIPVNESMDYGWNIWKDNWTPHLKVMSEVIYFYNLDHEDVTNPLNLMFHWEDDGHHGNSERWEWINYYQEYQIAIAQAFIDYLDDEKCRTRTSSLYRSIKLCVDALYDESLRGNVVENNTDPIDSYRINTYGENVPILEDENNLDLPFGAITGTLTENQVQVIESEQSENDDMINQMNMMIQQRRNR